MTTRSQPFHALAGCVSAVLIASAFMTACSDPADPAPGAILESKAPGTSVASLPSAPGAAPSPSAAVATEGPLIRSDTSPEEYLRLTRVYLKCLRGQGVPLDEQRKPGDSSLEPDQIAQYPNEIAACQYRKPERVEDRFKRENPGGYQAAVHDFIDCMNDHGQKIIFIAPDGWGVSDEDAASMTLDDGVVSDCETEAYGG